MRRLLSFIVLPVLAAFPAACGGSDTLASDPVAEAAAKTQAEGSVKVAMTMSMNVVGPKPFTMNGEGTGVFNNDNGSGRMTFTMRGEGVEAEFDFVYVMPAIYMRSPLFESELPDGKSWMKIDLARAGEELGLDMEALMNYRPTDAVASLEATAGEVEEVGTEAVRGIETTQYRATIDLEKAASEGPEELRESMARVAELTGISTIPVRVWVDEDGLIRRLAQTWNQELPDGAGRMHTEMTMDLYDFGPRIQVDAPPPGEVFDATALAGVGGPSG
jgi:hypothetical protein